MEQLVSSGELALILYTVFAYLVAFAVNVVFRFMPPPGYVMNWKESVTLALAFLFAPITIPILLATMVWGPVKQA